MDVKKKQKRRAVKVSHVKYTIKQNDNDKNGIQKACFYSHLWLERLNKVSEPPPPWQMRPIILGRFWD